MYIACSTVSDPDKKAQLEKADHGDQSRCYLKPTHGTAADLVSGGQSSVVAWYEVRRRCESGKKVR